MVKCMSELSSEPMGLANLCRVEIRRCLHMATAKQAADQPQIIGRNTGVSIALVIVIITGIVANLGMMFSLSESVSGFGITLEHQSGDVKAIKVSVDELTKSTRTELNELRKENMLLRERVTKLEAAINK